MDKKDELQNLTTQINTLVDQLSSLLKGKGVKETVSQTFIHIDNARKQLSAIKKIATPISEDAFYRYANSIYIQARALASYVKVDFSDVSEVQSVATNILSLSSLAEDIIKSRRVSHVGISKHETYPVASKQASENKILDSEKVDSNILEIESSINKLAEKQKLTKANIDTKVEELYGDLEKLKAYYKEKIKGIDLIYNNFLEDLKAKGNTIDNLQGLLASDKISKHYRDRAIIEEKVANTLRAISILLMFFVSIIVGYAFWETTQSNFLWVNSLFRLLFATLLSFPAAYLARESAKHRKQQYEYLDKSLDLCVIDPYIASLDSKLQEKIKQDIAQRIFVQRKNDPASSDDSSFNLIEVTKALIDKLDVKKG